MNFATRLHLAPKLRMSGARPLLPPGLHGVYRKKLSLSSVTMFEPKAGKVTRNGYLKSGMFNIWFCRSKMSKLVKTLVLREVKNVYRSVVMRSKFRRYFGNF